MKRLIFIHQGVSGDAEKAIARFGFSVVRLPSFYALGSIVQSHPDSLLFPLPDGGVLMHADYYGANRTLFDGLGLRYILTDEPVSELYPGDILLNALALDGVLYGRLDKISRFITGAYACQAPVKQGYARCSVLALGSRIAVTSDWKLADAMSRESVGVLLLPPGGIKLSGSQKNGEPDSEGGFIGGCGVMLDSATCGFFGDITAYVQYPKLSEYANTHGIKLLPLDGGPLSDLGGAVIV